MVFVEVSLAYLFDYKTICLEDGYHLHLGDLDSFNIYFLFSVDLAYKKGPQFEPKISRKNPRFISE